MPQDKIERSRAIRCLIEPKSVAVIGASADFRKVNGRPLKHLLEKGFGGRIMPVNPKYEEIAGLTCYASIEALPMAADLAIVAVPARDVKETIAALGRRGIPSAVVFSSGFGEMGQAGKALEAEVAEVARQAGVALLGPNCLGFINAFERVYATFSQYADGETGAGPVAFVTQSGAFGTAIAALIRQRGLGLGYFINTGNQVDLDFSELMLAVIEDPRIKVAAGYLEGVSDGEGLVRLAERCRELGKPLVLTKVGRLQSGAKAAASHTGAIAVSDTVFDAVMRQYGVVRARNEEQMLDIIEAVCQPRKAAGPGLGIATQSGGAGVMMADRAEEVGLKLADPSPATKSRLAELLPPFGSLGNPVDVTGQFVSEPELLRGSVIALLNDPNIDMAIVWLQLMTAHVDMLVGVFADILKQTDKPFFVCWVAAPESAIKALRALGIVVFPAGERAVEAAGALAALAGSHRKAQPSIMPPAMPAGLPQGSRHGLQDAVSAFGYLRDAGLPVADVELAATEDEAVEIWRRLGAPAVLKIESPDIAHKTDIGGVLLGLNDEAAIRRGFRALMENAAAKAPKARLTGVVVQQVVSGDLELIVGVKRDATFGMIVMVGLGGILVEVLKDVSFRKAPFDMAEALSMLAELKGSAMLDGVRGKPPADRAAIAGLLVRLSQWAAQMEPVLAELDLNPVMVRRSAVVIVDCAMIFD